MNNKRGQNLGNQLRRLWHCLLLPLIVGGIMAISGCGMVALPDSGWMPKVLSDTTRYLPDYSYAGYRWGEVPLPNDGSSILVTDFGAVPDDTLDDSDAILSAVQFAHAQPGKAVIEFPAGKFILKKILYIDRSDLVLRGAGSGPDGTCLILPVPMKDLPLPAELQELATYLQRNEKRVKSGELFSVFSWTGGFIWTRIPHKRFYPYLPEKDKPTPVVSQINLGKRGGHCFIAENPEKLQQDTQMKIVWFNREGKNSTLLRHLYGEGDVVIGERHWKFPERPLIEQIVTVQKISGDTVCIKEPLLHDLRSEWGTAIAPAELLSGVGFEHFRIEFPATAYAGHHLEHGYNAFYLTSLTHSWIRDVTVVNADNAVLSDEDAFVTIDSLTVQGRKGHYGIHFGKTNHMLAKNITIDAPMEHSVSFNTFAKAGVYSGVAIRQTPTLDQHCGTNHQNLFDNMNIVTETFEPELFKHGGAGYWKPTHGKYNAFWNISIRFNGAGQPPNTVRIPGIDDGPGAYLIGISGNLPIHLTYGPDPVIEGLNRPGIALPSLYTYQLQQRLAKKSQTE